MSNISDGVFTIQKGQGLTHAICKEIGLNEKQAKSLNASVWTQIMSEIDKQKAVTPDFYSGGNDIRGRADKNFVVHEGEVKTVSLKGVWNKILSIVNNALGTNFTSNITDEDADEVQSEETAVESQETSQAEVEQELENDKKVRLIDDSDGSIERKIDEIKEWAVTEQKRIMQEVRNLGGNWDQKHKDEYDDIANRVQEKLKELLGEPQCQKGEYEFVQVGERTIKGLGGRGWIC